MKSDAVHMHVPYLFEYLFSILLDLYLQVEFQGLTHHSIFFASDSGYCHKKADKILAIVHTAILMPAPFQWKSKILESQKDS
jgi:hypothetical protein